MTNKTKQDKPSTSILLEQIKANATIKAAAITALATILVGGFALITRLVERNEKIATLNAEIAQRDAQINLLTKELNDLKQPLRRILTQDGGVDFEWQWAGENWYGRVTLEQRGTEGVITQAQVGLLEKKLSDESSMTGQVFNMVPNTGVFNITDDGIVHLQFSTKKKDRRLGTIDTVIIAGDLRQTLCYVGEVSYKNIDTGNQYSGDMVLANHITQLGEQVDNWFGPNIDQTWFERYIVDR